MFALQHDDPSWPDGLDRTISTHDDVGDALQALSAALDQRRAQLDANGEGGSELHLAVVDATGEPVATADVHGQPPPAPGWPPWNS